MSQKRASFFPATLVFFLLAATSMIAAQTAVVDFDMTFVRGRVFRKSPDTEPFDSKPGQYRVPFSTSIITFVDGQCFMQVSGSELRLKQETILSLSALHSFELRQGLAGFKAGSEKLLLNTAHLKVELVDAIVVVKTNPALTRVCVVKGQVTVAQGKSIAVVKAGEEIAAAPQRFSQVYKQSDELRFTWYWVSADKEPALQAELN
ncbi:MAG: hypothetical protein KKB51_14645 [Candidatus Riflebacteria bacterium]|nr:hypothetical protein [Candidatus Riflebacteria bacterium]